MLHHVHHEPTKSNTAQRHNSVSSELMDITRPFQEQKEKVNRRLWENDIKKMKPYRLFDETSRQRVSTLMKVNANYFRFYLFIPTLHSIVLLDNVNITCVIMLTLFNYVV